MATSSARGRTESPVPAASFSSAATSIARNCGAASRVARPGEPKPVSQAMSAGVSAPMPGAVSADHILDTRGVKQDLGAFVVAAAFDRGGSIAGFALGDGTVRLARRGEAEWRRVEVHD